MLKNQKGFIELLILVAVVGIVVLSAVSKFVEDVKRKDCKQRINNENPYVKAGTAEGVISYIDDSGEKRSLKIIVVMDIAEKLPPGNLLIMDGDNFKSNGLVKFIKICTD